VSWTPFWRVSRWKPGRCWVCGGWTRWAHLDIGYQHPDCDAYPSEEGDVRIVRGIREETQ
jgi:hypothetical protein